MPRPHEMPPYMYPMMQPGMQMMPNPPMGSYMYPPQLAPRPEIMPMPVAPQPQAAPLPSDKETLGEYLYPMVESKDAANAAKITGMLLEMEVDQIHNIIRNPNQLDKWIVEANKVLTSSTAPSS